LKNKWLNYNFSGETLGGRNALHSKSSYAHGLVVQDGGFLLSRLLASGLPQTRNKEKSFQIKELV